MDTLLQDVRYALRAFAKAPGFSLVALLTMATAIGANTTVFSFVNALLMKPPAGVRSPDTLVSIYTSDFSSGPYGATSYPDFDSIRTGTTAFSHLAASRELPPTLLRVRDITERVRTMSVTADYFAALRLQPVAGRLIEASDTAEHMEPGVVLGQALWQRAFGANPSIVGASILLNGTAHTVVGVVPSTFTGLQLGSAFDLWTAMPARHDPSDRGNRNVAVIGRLAANTSLEQAQAQLDGVAAQLAASFPETNRGTLGSPDRPRPMTVVHHTRMHPNFRTQVRMIAAVLLGAVALVLMIACANVAGLLLSRASARGREVALRLALGASRARLLRQMLTESVILGIGGGLLGLLVALWTADALPSFFPAEQARLLNATLDGRVLAFTTAIALLSGLAFGIAPALQSLKAAPATALRSDANRAGDTRVGLVARKVLVISQVAIASVLLICATLLTRSLASGMTADLGFTTRQAILTDVELPRSMKPEAARAYFDQVVASARALPGVEDAALGQFVPVAGTFRRGFTMEGYVPREGEDTELHINVVSRGFFGTMGIAAASGRVFSAADANGRTVVVVNQTLADRYFGGNAVGRRLIDSSDNALEIVGVVRADRRLDLQDPPLPVVFYLLDHHVTSRVTLVARTASDPAQLGDTLRRTIAPINRDVAIFRTVTLEAHLDEALSANRLTVTLVATCGVIALALALVGVYGIVSYTVIRRTREIGVRVALGATPWQVVRLLVAENGAVVGAGLLIGVIAALGAARLLGSLLYAVSPTDALTYASVMSAVSLVASLACLLPARRALRLDPIAALRQD